MLTAFATNVKVLATSAGGMLELDPGGSFGGIVMHTPVLFGLATAPSSAASQGWIWTDGTSTKLTFLNGATLANAMTLDSSGNVNVAGTYQIAGTSIFATTNTWSVLQTFSAGLTVSAGTITFDTVPQTSVGGSTSNTGYGTNALLSNTSGANNTALGIGTLLNNTTGSANTASGSNALQQNTIGINNTAFGVGSLQGNTTGNYNTVVGTDALQQFNDTIGANDNHVAIGYQAGYNYTSAERNNTVLGAGVLGTVGESNTLRIGNPNTTLLLGNMTGVTTADYLSIAGMIATANGGVAPTVVTVPASGTAYTPSTTVNTELFISGGTVTVVAINGVNVGLLSGHVYMKKNDTITFTYTVAPTVYQMTA
jgi:hypothetical protein